MSATAPASETPAETETARPAPARSSRSVFWLMAGAIVAAGFAPDLIPHPNPIELAKHLAGVLTALAGLRMHPPS